MSELTAIRLPSLSTLLRARSVHVALLLFVVARVLITVWGALVVEVMPALPPEDEFLRALGGGALPADEAAGPILGPWQRFDTMHYLSIARQGYEAGNSVFPPLYPLTIRGLGAALALLPGVDGDRATLLAALVIANAALLAALVLLHHLTARVLDEAAASKALAYLLFFPSGFFLFAGYTESLFLLWALACVLAAKSENLLWAGLFGLLASLTRLTGWLLVVPLAYEYARQRGVDWRRPDRRLLHPQAVGVFLPLLGTAAFLLWREGAGLPPLGQVYEQYWFQNTAFPGLDVLVALRAALTGSGPRAGEYSLLLDLASLLLIVGSTALAFRRLGPFYGLYALALLFFMLLPTSAVKPLYSFSRYALAFFPLFMLLGAAGRRPWLNRLILYPSIVLYLFFSGQFFMGGWVG
ncbi:MAG: mannosyltransferase family protein [Chloroflexota bacterium]